MARDPNHRDSFSMDLPFGLILGLLFGFLAGVLFAPKPGKEFQGDVQGFFNRLPDKLNAGLVQSKVQYKAIVGKTRESIENQLELRDQRRRAHRMAEAKLREELEAGSYEY